MAGGSGTRFWPHSRRKRPKQLLSIAGQKTMIQATVERITPIIPYERIMVIAGAPHVDELKRQLPELGNDQVVAEPVGRNTAACIALAAYKLSNKDPEALMVVLPSDHLIGKEKEFLEAMKVAVDTVTNGEYLLMFGIVPNRPETGYGYIRIGERLSGGGPKTVYKVAQFVEKPDLVTAESYLASGKYMWNSGMFVWKAANIINALDKHLPKLSNAIREISGSLGTAEESLAIKQAYDRIEAVSIDHGVMEKADNVLCLPIDVDWNDVGSWASLESVWDCDDGGNAIRGQVVSLQSRECIVSSPYKLATLIGAENLIVVDTSDALMICRKDRAQDVRKLHEILKNHGYEHLL
ncbi:mannose-1-phosphate guanylyltransferase [Desulfomonile tiedjei]|nr:mannose-1-phosphate guanylyltransferase [Desulfomonile tiedjei]